MSEENIETSSNPPEPQVEDSNTISTEEATQNEEATENDEATKPNNEPNLDAEPNKNTLSCSLSIQFQDNLIADIYKSKFLNFLSSFKELQVINETDLQIDIQKIGDVDADQKKDDGNVISAPESTETPIKKSKKSKLKKELFVLDATPSLTKVCNNVARYTPSFVVNSVESEADAEDQSSDCPKVLRNGCFNCDGAHPLHKCEMPKNMQKIALAKQRLLKTRYHSEDNSYDQFQPGKISTELREALGLHADEAPRHIYLMRQMGYPPGWLEEAKVAQSDLLEVFDIDGKVEVTPSKKKGLDEKLIIEYPGFNAPFESGVKDDYRIHRVPPYSESCSKQHMIKFFEERCVEVEVMEMDENIQTFEMDDVSECIEPSAKKKKNLSLDPDRDSPSLIDLEQQKKQLLEALNDEAKEEVKQDQDEENEADKSFLSVKTSAFGTPLLKSSSPYSRLPNPDNFSKDVSPVIHFDNLPNSTGKYEQLTDVLQKVRTTLKSIQSGQS